MPANLADSRRLLLKAKTTKRWWVTLAVFIIVAVNVAGLFRPPRYQASALVLIRQPPIADQRVRDTFRLTDMLDTIRQRVTSFSFLSEIARKLNLDAGIPPDSNEYEQLIERMRKAITLNVEPEFFQLQYAGYTPREAYNVADAIVKLFITQSGEYYNDKAKKNVGFLDAQLRQARLEMDDAQKKIRAYKDAHIKEIPEAQAEHMSRLAKRRDEYQTSRQDLEAIRSALTLAQQSLKQIPKDLTTEVTQTDGSELRQLRSSAGALRMKIELLIQVNGYTEEHWEVKTARKQLALIEDQLASATQSVAKEITFQSNPRYADLQTRITEYQLKIGELQKRQVEQEADIKELEKYLTAIPKHQDELQTLERNYTIAAGQVESYLNQLDQARKASELEAQGMGPSFEIKDPPRVPVMPFSPNRSKIAAVSVVLGLGGAFGLIFLLALLDQSLRSIEEARQVLRMPMLGVVQRIVTPAQIARLRRRRRRRLLGLGAVVVLLIGVGALGYFRYREDLLLGAGNLRDFLKRW
jgi:polysaccharide chain length determinant protein (PEP-CTERM system associated)